MGVAGLGVDIIEIERMRKVLKRTPSFRERAFSETEKAYCDARALPEVHYALRFAAKEAVLKALGTGFGGVGALDVEVVNDEKGRPHAVLHGKAKQIADEQGIVEMHLSLSYTHDLGVANAVAIKEEDRPEVKVKVDPLADLDEAFRQAKSILDEVPTGRMAEPMQKEGEEDEAGTSENR
jgi:holo-[acyl-carrier protein] synthase